MLDSVHFREIPEHRGAYVVIDATREAARDALHSLPPGFYLGFYDATEPSDGGDPGTYFSLRRKNEGWQITGGNHGWSHGIAAIAPNEAERFLSYCLPSNRGPYPECLTYMPDTLPRHWEAQWSGAALAKRIAKVVGDEPKGYHPIG